jgi:hypothetical protein
VVAVDKDASGNLREGTASAVANVVTGNTPPFPPTNLTATSTSGGTVLSWTASPGDPNLGDSVDHYVIYRDGTNYGDRYDRTATGQQVTYTDTAIDGQTHTYWVAAIDTQLGQSTLLGPVTM